MRYLLDANVFIEAKNRYYGHDICPGFWNWLDKSQGSGLLASIEPVYNELAGKGDELSLWIEGRHHTGWFLDIDDEETQKSYADVVNEVYSGDFTWAAKTDFLKGADPWLIAKARILNAAVVTHEKFDPKSKKKIHIPTICKKFAVDHQDPFDLLRANSASFVLA